MCTTSSSDDEDTSADEGAVFAPDLGAWSGTGFVFGEGADACAMVNFGCGPEDEVQFVLSSSDVEGTYGLSSWLSDELEIVVTGSDFAGSIGDDITDDVKALIDTLAPGTGDTLDIVVTQAATVSGTFDSTTSATEVALTNSISCEGEAGCAALASVATGFGWPTFPCASEGTFDMSWVGPGIALEPNSWGNIDDDIPTYLGGCRIT